MVDLKDNRDLFTLSPDLANALPVNQPIPNIDDDADFEIEGNVSMDLEAEPVPTSSSSSLPAHGAAVMHPPPPIPAQRSILRQPSSKLNCCTAATTTLTRSPLKPVNRENRVAQVRKIPDDVFWL